ncbi:DUF2169 family type VI secretion system accessory protein, partial [Piscinibacter sp.]|uniref:DUF2169 family type VI secretion system accessory protein n=1 Tax=Piscinibacter sp. TaxID=1903157 RepID=UPI002CC999C4
MKVISPLRIGIGLRPLPQRRGHSSVLTGRLSFDLLQPANFVPDAKLWPLVQAAAGTEPPFDAGMHKPNAEVLLWGEACSATPVEEAIVELRCGAVAKRLRVIGNRHWQPGPLGWRASRAEPFTRMPLAWDRSFGGEAFDRCPVGQGHDGERRLADREHVMLPNLETPGSPLLHPGDIAEPACFAAVDPRWPCARPDGTYDAHWLASQHPAAPADESPAVHNLAPLDQRLPGRHFLGGEPIEIRGMHPEHALIASHVPALRMWAFFVRRGADELEAIELKADTLSLLPGALLGVLHFRAILADTGPDLRSISSLMMAAEWADRPKPLEHYVATHRLRSDPEHGAEHMLRDLQLMPELTEDQRTRREAVRERQRAARAVEDKAFKAALDRKIIGPAGSARAAFMLSAIAASAAARPPGDLDSDALDRVQWPEITEEDGELGDVDFAGISRAADETRSIAAQLMAQSQRDVGQAAAESEKMAAELEQQAQTLRAAMAADKQTLLAGEHLAVRSPLLPPEVVRPDIDTRASMRSFAERLESGSGSSNDALLEFMLEQGGAPLDDAQRASVQHDWANAMAQAQWSDDPASRARTASGLRDAMAQADTLPSRRPAGAPPPDSNAAGAILGRLKFAETADGGVEAAALPDIGVAADGPLDMQGL